jgi:hypothetical protein
MKKFLVIAMLLIATISWSACNVSPCDGTTSTYGFDNCELFTAPTNDCQDTPDLNFVGEYQMQSTLFNAIGVKAIIGVDKLVITENSWYIECTTVEGDPYPCGGAYYSWYVDTTNCKYPLVLNLPPYQIHAKLVDHTMLIGYSCGVPFKLAAVKQPEKKPCVYQYKIFSKHYDEDTGRFDSHGGLFSLVVLTSCDYCKVKLTNDCDCGKLERVSKKRLATGDYVAVYDLSKNSDEDCGICSIYINKDIEIPIIQDGDD